MEEEGTVGRGASVAKRDTVLILDFGGQYTHLIGRSVRENNVYSEIVPYDISADDIRKMDSASSIRGIILSGGPDSVYEKDAPGLDPAVLELGMPVLGLCYGHQLIAHMSGGKVRQAAKKEYGDTEAIIDRPEKILHGLHHKEKVWMSHGDTVASLPDEWEVLAHTDNTPVAAFCHRSLQIYGLQWHPEVVQTEHGSQVIRNFIFGECKCQRSWKMADFADSAIGEVRSIIGSGKAVVALSGGVDSSVAAALVTKAIGGHNLVAVYVDTGLMREGETGQIRGTFTKLGTDLRIINAGDRFLKGLSGVTDPEQKRRIIGRVFAEVFEEQARASGAEYLVQGTIYPDRVESGRGGKSALIKTHHNVGGLPKGIKFRAVVEPLRDLYKDEVRKVGRELGLPEQIVKRQPFPGPGLAVMVIGEVTREKLGIARRADHIVTEEMERSGLSDGLWQYFAVLTNTTTTGVRGDGRAYGYLVSFRALVSREAMTARFAELPWELVRRISTRITNEIPEVVRVAYDVTDKPPATVEWE
jgi:GMP synthase (glutamine-hydrolysing)